MSEAPDEQHEEGAQLPSQRPYHTPELRQLGSAADLTSGSTAVNPNTDGPYPGS